MKTRLVLLLGAAGLLAPPATRESAAQFAGPPRVSPYLNLVRQGTPAGVNYYGLVRPEIEFRQGIQRLQQQSLTNRQAISDLAAGANLPVTGHAVGFMNHLIYFNTLPPPGSTTGLVSPTTQAPGAPRPPSGGSTPSPRR